MLKSPMLEPDAPWKQRFRAPSVLWTGIAAAAPARGVVASNQTGRYQLYAWEVGGGELRQLTDRAQGQVFGTISPDGRFIYYLNDTLGNELGHYVRVPFEGGEPQDITPDLPNYASFNLTFAHTCELAGFVLADAAGFHVYALPLGADDTVGAPRRLATSSGLVRDLALSYDGALAAISTDERAGRMHFSVQVFDTATGQPVSELSDGPENSIQPVAFAPAAGDTRLLAMTNASGANRPLIWDVRSGDRTDLALDDLQGEVQPVAWSPDGRRLLLVHYSRAVQQMYIYDVDTSERTRLDHPGGTFSFFGDSAGTYFGSNSEIFAHWEDSTHPPRLIALDARTGAPLRTILEASSVPQCRPWRSVTFESTDGELIQGWLATPEGEGPFPTILETHGGPTAATTETFSPESQVWLDHGYAFLSINYRGSTTFGRKFQEQIVGNLGHWEVQDMVAARNWLVENGIADPSAILLTGWSYGGYLTLHALGREPELWAGGMAGIAIADWTLSYHESADTLRGYQLSLFGGTPEEKPDVYAASSPITYAEHVSAPVLIIQGRSDTRTPAQPIVNYEKKMKALGKPIEVHWFETGHQGAFADVELGIDHHERILQFAHQVLGVD